MPRQLLYLTLDFAGLIMELATYILMLIIGLAVFVLAATPFALATAVLWGHGLARRWWAAPAEALREPEGQAPHKPESILMGGDDAKIKAVLKAYLGGKPIEIRDPDQPGDKPWYYCGSDHPCHHETESGARVCRMVREYQHQEVTR